jgi:hypothetical protein
MEVITIHKIELFELARTTMEEYLCRKISDERFIYDAYIYAQHYGNEYDLAFQVRDDIDDLLEYDKLSDEVEDYCLAILSAKSGKEPEPLEFPYNPKRLRQKYYYG